MQQKRLMV